MIRPISPTANDKNESAIEPLTVGIDGAAQAIGVSTMTVRRLVEAGKLPRLKIGRTVRFRPADLRAYVDRTAAYENSPATGEEAVST